MNLLRRMWGTWNLIGQFIGDIVGRIVLTLFYFTLFAPFGLAMQISGDPLAIKGCPVPTWIKRLPIEESRGDMQRLSQ